MRYCKSLFFTLILLVGSNLGSCQSQLNADFYTTERNCGVVTLYNPVKGTQSTWHNLRFSDNNLDSFNVQHHLFFVENCQSLNWSSDKRIVLLREVVSDTIKEHYDYMEAPYVAIDRQSGDYASYIAFPDEHIRLLSLGGAKAAFVNEHDLALDGVVYQLASDFIRELPMLIQNKDIKLKQTALQDLFTYHPLSGQNVMEYSKVALVLENNHEYQTAIFLLEVITAQFPEYTPAYLTLGDAYWNDGQFSAAKSAYRLYLNLMESQGKDLGKVPEYVQTRSR